MDKILNRISMYRLAIYYLASLLVIAAILGFFEILPYNPSDIVFSSLYLAVFSYISNILFSKLRGVKANQESAIITALILSLIVGPLPLENNLLFLSSIAAIAMASKYVMVWRNKHIFNPAAFAVLLSAILLGRGASWWVGTAYLAPVVIIFGLILAKKIGREKMIGFFLLTYFILITLLNIRALDSTTGFFNFALQLTVFSPILFFAFVMLPEPQTSPKENLTKIWYGISTAALFILYQNILTAPYTLELALISGNIFTFIMSNTTRINATLRSKKEIAPNIYCFWFDTESPLHFIPGQFLEWTVYHGGADSRGIRRYFTIASSPTEEGLLVTTKFPKEPSSFKKELLSLEAGSKATATGPEGEFVLPEDTEKKLVFIAGGIGVTPFRSIAKYLVDKKESRDIVLMYSANTAEEFVFKDIFESLEKIQTVYAVSKKESVPENWQGETGHIDTSMIARKVPDWKERLFYISGPEPMVKAMEKTLADLGVEKENIRRDYFPGYEEI